MVNAQQLTDTTNPPLLPESHDPESEAPHPSDCPPTPLEEAAKTL